MNDTKCKKIHGSAVLYWVVMCAQLAAKQDYERQSVQELLASKAKHM